MCKFGQPMHGILVRFHAVAAVDLKGKNNRLEWLLDLANNVWVNGCKGIGLRLGSGTSLGLLVCWFVGLL